MTTTQSGTIDGISYASSKYVYDTHGDGIVTDILYYDQAGKQVADRSVFAWPPFDTSAPIANADGTFSVKVTPPPGDHGNDPTYLLETFSSTGIWLREDDYAGLYKDPNNPSAGISGYAETAHQVANVLGAGSSGTINGAYYDMTISTYNAAGQLSQISYFNDLDGNHQMVGVQYAPSPEIALSPTGTATTGTPDTPLYASFTDPWAANHAGSLALNISVDAGSVTGTDSAGHAFSATPGSAVHLTGTVAQLNADLASLSFVDQSAGIAHLTLQIYDQAGASATRTQTITVSGSGGGTGATSPNPVIGGATTLSIPADGTLQGVGATFSDPWAANHAGSLAMNVSTTIGVLSDAGNGHIVSGTSLHFTGTYAQIESDIANLAIGASQAGTGSVRIEIYDQAGVEAVHLVGVTAHASAST